MTSARMHGLIDAIDQFERWHVSSVLPLWSKAGVDCHGGFFEALDYSGAPVAGALRRSRVQSRQAHTFADAGRRGWLEDGAAIAQRGFARLLDTACPDSGRRGCAHRLDAEGRIVDHLRDFYDQAFLLLASASLIASADDRRAAACARQTLEFLDREFASPKGGYKENDRSGFPRRQNPHMHLFEALMALFAATKDPSFLTRAKAVADLFDRHFFDRKQGLLLEHFNDDLSPLAGVAPEIEPGHMAEWVFLLDRFASLTGENRSADMRMLFEGAVSMRDHSGFLPNVAAPGVTKASARRLWPQLEFLRAAFILAREGDDRAAGLGAEMIEKLFNSYFNQPTPGLWCDEYDANGAPLAKEVPASIVYHIHEAVCCAVECRHKLLQ